MRARIGHETASGADFTIAQTGAGTAFRITSTGNLTLLGTCVDDLGDCATPDYVFEQDYEMLTLEQLEAFITANKHLPNVPSAADVKANGFNVQGMTNATLEKVEELVLYTLQQQKTIEDLQARLKALEEKQQ